jgi:hypothetical protein
MSSESHFFRLPREIRAHIYGLLNEKEGSYCGKKSDTWSVQVSPGPFREASLVSKIFKEEYEDEFFRDAKLRLRLLLRPQARVAVPYHIPVADSLFARLRKVNFRIHVRRMGQLRGSS